MTSHPTSIVKLFAIAAIVFFSEVASFKVARPVTTSRGHVQGSSLTNKGKLTSSTQLHMDATLIPLLIGATGLIFAVFNFDNKIDLTDSGMAKAKAMRYNARKERGEIPSKEAVANLDPYRWFADEDEEVDMITPKKKGGGCG